nr:uncharacterized protein LOC115264003 [Aedes albopictus]
MSDSETPRGVLQTISKRNILEALTGSRSEKVPPVPSVAEQKIARQVLEKKKMMESKLEVLSDRRDLITERLIRMKESLKGDGINIHLLNLHLETLRRCADDFDKIRVEISALLPKEQRIIARQEYEVFEDIHNELYVDLQTRIAQSQEASRITPGMSNSLSIPGPQQPIIVQAAAPQLHAPFPTFDGTPENWYSFKSLFKSIMAKYPNETPAMKILHLRNSLEGDAKSKIDQNVVNNNDYEKAWKILENAYEDRRLILDTHIDAILGCANVNKENRGKSISELVETCSKHVDALEGHSYPVEGLGELILLNVLYKKLDKETQEQWEMKVPKGEVPEYEMFIEFLRERGRVLERTNRSQQQVQQSTFQPKQRFAVAGQRASAQSSKSFVQTVTEACPCCQAEHTIYKCQKFQNMDFLERKSVAAKAGLCYNCLKQRHRVNDCQSDQGCKVQGCGRKHHSLLHPNDEVRQNQPETRSQSPAATDKDSNPAQQERSGPCATTMCAQIDLAKRQVLLSTAVVLIVGHGGVPVKCRALLDSGSDSHVLSEKLANQLMLKKNRIDIPISGLNDIQTKVNHQERNLNETMAKFWEIEDVRLGSSLSAAEAAVEEHFKETHARDEQGRYIVRLPFNDKKSQLGDSFVMAKKRYERLMISLAKNPEKRMQYAAFMAEYIDLGHMKEADDPRELCGAKLLAELVQKVTTSMAIHFDEVNLWCDSQIVLCWLKKSPLALNQFVANRVAAILELTPGCSWLYVQSEQNPADIISRGTMPNELVHNDMWWNGPSLLWQSACKEQDPEEWDETELPELKPAKCLAIISKNLPITFDRVSDFRKLQRAWAYVMRFINLKKEKRVISVTAEEMRNAEKVIFQLVQKETYSELLKQLMSKSSKRHNLSNLAPFIGEDGLIRVGGRLKYSAIPYEGKHQVLLPEKHHVTEILVRKLHEENHHVGQGGLLAIIRERYWPVKVKSVIKKTISKCQVVL